MAKRRQLAINLRGNSIYKRVGDKWEAYFPLLDVRASGDSEVEARRALRLALEPVVNHGSAEVKAKWQHFCQTNLIEVEMTKEEVRNERSVRERAAALDAGQHSPFRALDPADFDAAIAGPKPVLVDFWAAWCHPCVAMVPALEAVATALSRDVDVMSVDVEAHPSIWERLDLRGIPTMVVFRDGMEIGRILGSRSEQDLLKELRVVLGVAP